MDNKTIDNLNLDFGDVILDDEAYNEEYEWKRLIEQVKRGNVIPVINGDMVYTNNQRSSDFLLEAISRVKRLPQIASSFTSLTHDPRSGGSDQVHYLVEAIIRKNPDRFQPTQLLRDFLSLKYFPFVLTTTFDPIVENTMREIHGDKLRVLAFYNQPSLNEDIKNAYDTEQPTLYYMFGKALDGERNFVLTETDLLKFCRSWLLPKDHSNKEKPAHLTDALANKYLLVLGNRYEDWLFRFLWFAMKDSRIITQSDTPIGMNATEMTDEKVIEFLNYANITNRHTNLTEFVQTLKEKLHDEPVKETVDWFAAPHVNTDVFISYSRADSEIAERLYEALTAQGLTVWYDKKNLGSGDNFKDKIRSAIRSCKLFVPILSDSITRQAAEEHIYRLEWAWAIEHYNQISSGIAYMKPLAERSFDFYNEMAGIPDEIQAHNAATYSPQALPNDLETFAQEVKKTTTLLKTYTK